MRITDASGKLGRVKDIFLNSLCATAYSTVWNVSTK